MTVHHAASVALVWVDMGMQAGNAFFPHICINTLIALVINTLIALVSTLMGWQAGNAVFLLS